MLSTGTGCLDVFFQGMSTDGWLIQTEGWGVGPLMAQVAHATAAVRVARY
jgi:hypothetical protein